MKTKKNERKIAKKMMTIKGKMKRYEFHITIVGAGENPDEAWQDAYEGFSQDPGITPDESEYTAEDIEETDAF